MTTNVKNILYNYSRCFITVFRSVSKSSTKGCRLMNTLIWIMPCSVLQGLTLHAGGAEALAGKENCMVVVFGVISVAFLLHKSPAANILQTPWWVSSFNEADGLKKRGKLLSTDWWTDNISECKCLLWRTHKRWSLWADNICM